MTQGDKTDDFFERMKDWEPDCGSGIAKPPSRRETAFILEGFLSLAFPGYFSQSKVFSENLLIELQKSLESQIDAAYTFSGEKNGNAKAQAKEIMAILPSLKEKLLLDAAAAYDGDPAARSPDEIILSYPGFFAVAIYRLAHELYTRRIPYLARMMTEYAHSKTGIDIHPGAKIGEYFFIDHGTGVVIGETATIGNRVKIYQGVTIGAKSFDLDGDGNPVKGVKRHPDIGNGCVIYAGATILGGDTVIGDNCVIGGNVWLTHSVAAGQTIYFKQK